MFQLYFLSDRLTASLKDSILLNCWVRAKRSLKHQVWRVWLLGSTWVAMRRTITCSKAASAPICLGSPCNGPMRPGTIDQTSTSSPIGDRRRGDGTSARASHSSTV